MEARRRVGHHDRRRPRAPDGRPRRLARPRRRRRPRRPAEHRGPRIIHRAEPVVLTWGLIGPGKGLEYGIESMAYLSDLDPAPVYVDRGRDAPEGVGSDRASATATGSAAGGRPRRRATASCSRTATSTPPSLRSLIRSADVVLLPYESREQICSGVLVEAVSAGKPVVATAFPHAVEQLVQRLRHRGAARGPRGHRAARSGACSPTTRWPDRCAPRPSARPSDWRGRSIGRRNTSDWLHRVLAEREQPHDPAGAHAPHLQRMTDDTGLVRARDRLVPRRARRLVHRRQRPRRSPSPSRVRRRGRRGARGAIARVPRAGARRRRPVPAAHGLRPPMDGRPVLRRRLRARALRRRRRRRELAVAAHRPGGPPAVRARVAVPLGASARDRARGGRPRPSSAARRQPVARPARSLVHDWRSPRCRAARHDEAWPWPEARLTYGNALLPEALIAGGRALGDDARRGRGPAAPAVAGRRRDAGRSLQLRPDRRAAAPATRVRRSINSPSRRGRSPTRAPARSTSRTTTPGSTALRACAAMVRRAERRGASRCSIRRRAGASTASRRRGSISNQGAESTIAVHLHDAAGVDRRQRGSDVGQRAAWSADSS